MTLEEIGNYHLLYELLKNGRGNLYPELEPIELHKIVNLLKNRSGEDYGSDQEKWINWFLESDLLNPVDKTNLGRIKKIADAERRYSPLIDKKKNDQ